MVSIIEIRVVIEPVRAPAAHIQQAVPVAFHQLLQPKETAGYRFPVNIRSHKEQHLPVLFPAVLKELDQRLLIVGIKVFRRFRGPLRFLLWLRFGYIVPLLRRVLHPVAPEGQGCVRDALPFPVIFGDVKKCLKPLSPVIVGPQIHEPFIRGKIHRIRCAVYGLLLFLLLKPQEFSDFHQIQLRLLGLFNLIHEIAYDAGRLKRRRDIEGGDAKLLIEHRRVHIAVTGTAADRHHIKRIGIFRIK